MQSEGSNETPAPVSGIQSAAVAMTLQVSGTHHAGSPAENADDHQASGD